MSNSLRDKLLELGFKAPAKPPAPAPQKARHGERSAQPTRQRTRPDNGKATGKPSHPGARSGREASAKRPPAGRSQEEVDLGKAYALRARQEKLEREAAERERQEQARIRREAKARVAELLKDAALNDPAADIARHFPYGGKIKRIYVTEDQLKALNAGELGVAQQQGRYVLVEAALLARIEAVFPDAVALKVDPDAPGDADPYSDPRYQVPDDLVW
jgi:uncharacterized protein YaiL (DUF2058 family)